MHDYFNELMFFLMILVYVVCRLGNDSQKAVQTLNEHFLSKNTDRKASIETIKDLIGGITAWANTVDKNFPKY